MAVSLGEIAEFLGARLQGDAACLIEGVAELKSATPSFLSFLANPKYASLLAESRAGALLIGEPDVAKAQGKNLLVSSNPYRDFARVLAKYFDKRSHPAEGVHPMASVHPGATLGKGVRLGAFCVVEQGAQVGEGCILYPFSYVGPTAKLGRDCLLYPNAVLMEGCVLGDRVILQAGAVIGADGFGFAPDPPRGYVKIPQTGNVVIEDDVEIQANACVDRAVLGSTVIGKGSKIDNLVQIAHNVKVGQHSVFASQAGISGSTVVGNWVTFAGQAAAGGHLSIGDQAIVTGQAGAGKDVPAKAMVSGSPAQPTLEHHRGLVEMTKLPELKKRVKILEARLAELEKRIQH
jgi:UDP-3-O-[3-hydroxymyristoyl] glucosamine N-acyltransferase